MKNPSQVFTGQDFVAWLLQNVDIDDLGDSLHLSHLLAAHGYVFPVISFVHFLFLQIWNLVFQIDDHVLTMKNDGTYYRFQTPYTFGLQIVGSRKTPIMVGILILI